MNNSTNNKENLVCFVYGWLDDGHAIRLKTPDLLQAIDHAAQFQRSTLDIRWDLPPNVFGIRSTARVFEQTIKNKKELIGEIEKEIAEL